MIASIVWITFALLLGAAPPPKTAEQRAAMLIVVGAPGDAEYAKQFEDWAAKYRAVAEKGGAVVTTLGLEGSGDDDHQRLQQWIAQQDESSGGEMWIVLLGHGTFDGKTPKFNLRGPDVSAQQLAEWIKPVRRTLVIINAFSASGVWLPALSGDNRVVITATKSGYEQNFTRFGGFLAAAIGDAGADLDKDGQTSLLEAFLVAWRQAGEFFEADGRLATEHALLDDNGDTLGTRGDWYKALRPVKKPADKAQPDGFRAHQIHLLRSSSEQQMPPELRAKRDELELAVFKLREQKKQMKEAEYYARLESLLIDMAKLYETTNP